MRVRLTLSADEWKGVATVVYHCCRTYSGREVETLEELTYGMTLEELFFRLAARVRALKGRGNRLTLADVEVLALWATLPAVVELLMPYEAALGYRMLAEIDRQWHSEKGRWESNKEAQRALM